MTPKDIDSPVVGRDKRGWKWWSGSNDEFFTNGPFATRDEAIDALDEERGYVIHALSYPLKFTADLMINDQYFGCEDYFSGEYGEAERVGKPEDIAAADAELQTLLDAWTDKWRHTFVAPEMFANQTQAEFVEAAHILAGPLTKAEEVEWATLNAKREAGECSLDELSRYFRLDDRKEHFDAISRATGASQ